ncbi:MAG: hypothetical protein WD793_02225 [Steroidobacteraceae bacterium]
MIERLRRVRLLALLAARDRGRADELLRAVRPGSEGLAAELNRPSIERKPFLSAPGFARIVNALDDSDEAISRAAKLADLLRHYSNHRPLMETSDTREAITNSAMLDGDVPRAIDALIWDLRGLPPRERWARGHDPALIGKRGTPKEKINRWRALLVFEIHALVPEVKDYKAIAELLRLTSVGLEERLIEVLVAKLLRLIAALPMRKSQKLTSALVEEFEEIVNLAARLDAIGTWKDKTTPNYVRSILKARGR